jgi:gas vesicle protein
MSNRDGFSGGFWLGTLVGGVVGGIVGASIANQRANRLDAETDSGRFSSDRGEKRPFKSSRTRTFDRMELARRSLDDKISDLNNAIDSVRSSIGHPPEETIDLQKPDLSENIKTPQSSDPLS